MGLPKTAEAVVIGGGINGASIAYHLARLGMTRVVEFEAVRTAHGASSRGAGIIRTYYSDEAEARLAIASLATFRNWREEVGGTAGYRSTGFLWMVGPHDVPRLKSIVVRQRELGTSTRVVTPDELIDLQPHLDKDGIGAVAFEPDGGYGDPVEAVASLHTASHRLGVSLYERVPIIGISTDAGRVTGVSTAEGSVSSPLVILAAGAWSAPLAGSAGVSLPLTPVRMTTGTIRHAPLGAKLCTFVDTVTDTFFRPGVEQGVAHISIRDARHNTVLDAGNVWTQEIVDPTASIDGISRLKRRIPSLEAKPLRAWVGPDGVTPDKRAIYGNVESLGGLVLCVGGNYKGFKVAPAVGRSLAEHIVLGSSNIDITSFALERFVSPPRSSAVGRYSLSDVA
jgi:glycine/D-amino acid oxidase-like deaminating enzyme